MSDQQPSTLKVWVQTQLGKALFKVYQVKMAIAKALGPKSTSDGAQEGEPTPNQGQ
jgi:hypothetical protein